MLSYSRAFSQYTKELSSPRFNPLSREEERRLLSAYASGSTLAYGQLVEAHLRAVVYALREYKVPSEVDMMDLIQEGNAGLMEGITRFDFEKYKCRVFTYCFYWIRFYVTTSLKQYQKIRSVFSPFPEHEDPVQEDDPIAAGVVAGDIVKHVLKELPDREKTILIHFYGLTPPYQPKTLEEIGSMLHMHIERVRQLKNVALTKLKKERLSKVL